MTRYCVFVLVCLFNLQSCAQLTHMKLSQYKKWNEIHNLTKAILMLYVDLLSS